MTVSPFPTTSLLIPCSIDIWMTTDLVEVL